MKIFQKSIIFDKTSINNSQKAMNINNEQKKGINLKKTKTFFF